MNHADIWARKLIQLNEILTMRASCHTFIGVTNRYCALVFVGRLVLTRSIIRRKFKRNVGSCQVLSGKLK